VSISQGPASTVTPLASEHEAAARRRILSIVTTLGSAQNREMPESHAALAERQGCHQLPKCRRISQMVIAVLKHGAKLSQNTKTEVPMKCRCKQRA
jgi:hypothetical protein